MITAESISEPKQPSRLLKKKNMTASYPARDSAREPHITPEPGQRRVAITVRST